MTNGPKSFTCFYPSRSLVLANQVKVIAGSGSFDVPAIYLIYGAEMKDWSQKLKYRLSRS